MSSRPTATVTVHALSSGSLTLPSKAFVYPAADDERLTVPSLSFLIQHRTSPTAEPVRLVFDLGIRRIHTNYPVPLREHLKSREPFTTVPDVSESLAKGGLTNDDIDFVAFSHVHWDHVGTPSDFETSTFVVGHGSLALLERGSNAAKGSHAHFERDLLPGNRTIELPKVGDGCDVDSVDAIAARKLNPDGLRYAPLDDFNAIDVFGTGLVYLVDAPGHLQGHQNLLVRLSEAKWLYLAGDAAHDRRILRGTHSVATWVNELGQSCSIHSDMAMVQNTLDKIRVVEEQGLRGCEVEVVFAHDVEWLDRSANRERFWPSQM